MDREGWVPVADDSSLREGEISLASPAGISIILIRKAGEVHALRNRCAHMSCTLAGGYLEGHTLHCPCHDWRYDIRTGGFLDAAELRVTAYEAKSQGGKVYVKLEEAGQ